MHKIYFIFIVLIISSCSFSIKSRKGKEPIQETDIMFCNDMDCSKKHPDIVGFERIEDSAKYSATYILNTSKVLNFDAFGGIHPGDTVVVLKSYNNDISKIKYYNSSEGHAFSRTMILYIWNGFLVENRDSIASCWDGYERHRF
jgi:hypothetical protein